jgi:hypothetical protein
LFVIGVGNASGPVGDEAAPTSWRFSAFGAFLPCLCATLHTPKTVSFHRPARGIQARVFVRRLAHIGFSSSPIAVEHNHDS